MSNASLKDQLQAVAAQLSDTVVKEVKPKQSSHQPSQPSTSLRSPPQRKFQPVAKLKKPKPRWLEYVQYGVELLKVYYPACFKPMNEIKPLKKGIKQDLIKHLSTLTNVVTEDKACMVKSLAYYVNTAPYHKSVIEGATRIDLEGNSAGTVTAEEAKYSVDRQHAKTQAKQETKTPEAEKSLTTEKSPALVAE